MPALSDDVKCFIVQALACFDSPSTVAEAVNTTFGLHVPRQQIESYDPGRRAGRALSTKWREMFDSTRALWRKEVAEIPIANRITRLRALERLASKAENMKNYALTMQVLEQAAKEVGGMYESRRQTAGSSTAHVDMPPSTPVVREGRIVLRPDEPVPSRPIL